MGLRVSDAEELVAGSSSATAALHLAVADAYVALRDWPHASERIELARARIASGLDACLHKDRDEAGLEGGGQALMSTFLKHRESENKMEAERLAALVAEGAGDANEFAMSGISPMHSRRHSGEMIWRSDFYLKHLTN